MYTQSKLHLLASKGQNLGYWVETSGSQLELQLLMQAFFLFNVNVNQALDFFLHCILFCWFEFSLLRSFGILVVICDPAEFSQIWPILPTY